MPVDDRAQHRCMTFHKPTPARGSGGRRRRAAAVAVSTILALTAAGCANDVTAGTARQPGTRAMMVQPGSRAMMHGGRHGLMAESWVRNEADFLTKMIAHHEEAVAAARELRRSDRPAMRRLGHSIVITQTRELQLMRQWLSAWYPRTPPAGESTMMLDLSSLDGANLDTTFLREMIRHHMAAVMMSHRLFLADLVRHRAVGALARDIARTQADEIVTMQRLLGRMPGR